MFVARPRIPQALLLASVLLAFAGQAQGETEAIRLQYRADPQCPSAKQFQRQVFERTQDARLAGPDEAARVFGVELTREATGIFTGSLVVHEADGATVARRVTGRDCGQVALVLALATALAIDPHAELAPQQRLEEGLKTEPTAKPPRTTPAPASQPAAATPSSDAAPDVSAGPELGPGLDSVPEEPRVGGPSYPWSLAAALGPRATLGVVPEAAVGGGLYLEARHNAPGLPWSIGIELAALWTPQTRVQSAQADFRFLLARPQVCALSYRPSSALQIGPCLATEIGVVTGAGSAITYGSTEQRFWSALEAALRFELTLSETWFGALDAGLMLPLTRYRFVFNAPDTLIHPVPVAAAVAALRVGVRY